MDAGIADGVLITGVYGSGKSTIAAEIAFLFEQQRVARPQRARQAAGVPLRVVRLEVPLPEIERRLAGDVTSGRGDDLRAAAGALLAAVGTGMEDLVIANDRPAGAVAREVLDFLGWSARAPWPASRA